MNDRAASGASATFTLGMLAVVLGVGLTGSVVSLPGPSGAARAPAGADAAADLGAGGATREAAAQAQLPPPPSAAFVGAARPVEPAVLHTAMPAAWAPSGALRTADYFERLTDRLRWRPVWLAGSLLRTPDTPSRLLLARAAAQYAGLHEVGLSHRDLYGIISAETSWIPRQGVSKDGTPNLGIAQFEPATARAVGLSDPADPVQAVHAAAAHLKEAAQWSARRIAGLSLTPEQHAAKLREGVSIYYNLSTRGRNHWNGLNTAGLPVETRRHIANARDGAREAANLETQLRSQRARLQG